jgi:hypothetical protein
MRPPARRALPAHLLVTLCLLALNACGGAAAAPATCHGVTTDAAQLAGDCTRTIDRLAEAETQHLSVKTSSARPYVSVAVTLTVQSGMVAATFVNERGDIQTIQAAADQPAAANLSVQLDSLNQIDFDLAPVGGSVEGVDYQVSYLCACLP